MAVSVRAKFTPSDIARLLKAKKEIIEEAILGRLKFVGEKFIRNARTNGNYKDQTGNLRSSIGYVILKDGKQIFTNFRGKKEAGQLKAIEVANEAAEEFKRGFVLIVVAGMEYAASVESKSYDVLTASSLLAEQDLKAAIEELKNKIGRIRK